MHPNIANALPALPIVLPMLAASVLAGLRKQLPRSAADSIAIGVTALNLALTLALLHQAQTKTIVYWFGNWYPRGSMVLGITFVIDPVSAGLAALAATLTLLALIFSWRFVDAGANHFQPLMLIFLAGMTGFSLTGDLFNLFVFFELMSTAAFALCGLKTRDPAPLQGAFNFAVTNTVAAFLILIGISFLYAVTGALNIAQIGLLLVHRHDPLVLFACALITSGFLTKAAIVPFHFWLPDAHAVAPTPVCVLFSGLMVELGLYAIVRLYAVIFLPALDTRAPMLRAILLTFGVLTVVVGSLMCYAEHHVKRILAFSTVTHSGLMLIGIASSIGSPPTLGIAGFLTYLIGHAFVKSALFFVAGILLHRLRTASEPALFGRGKELPFTAALWFLGGLGLAAFPGFATMNGEALISGASEANGNHWVSFVFLFAGVFTSGAVIRVGLHTFLGWGSHPLSDRASRVDELPEDNEDDQKTFWYHFLPPVICIATAIIFALSPYTIRQTSEASARLASQPAYLHAVYTGVGFPIHLPPAQKLDLVSSAMRSLSATSLALLLALTSVFRKRISRVFRLGAYLEGPMVLFRTLQSGHVGDYVLWLTIGSATLGAAYVVLLR
jgi:multicomponent Na+:H+ antiporter subunit D